MPLGAQPWRAVTMPALTSNGQTLATLGATSIDDLAATGGLHAGAKTVGAGALQIAGLVSALHGNTDRLWTMEPTILCFLTLIRQCLASSNDT